MIPVKSRLILALDVTERQKAVEIAGKVAGFVDAIKVNYPLVLATDLSIVDEMSKFAPVICDFKIADIPNTNSLIVKNVLKHGASGVIVHGFVGKDSVRACIDAAQGMETFVVTEMSHPGALDYLAAFGESLARLAVETGATGVVAPATRPERVADIRKIVGKLKIISPGVGAQGGSASDTIRAGADYVIVGRQIYNAGDPAKEAANLAEEIKNIRASP
jgi:orotidine-5'-phosphate decarboxylase